MWYIPFIFFGSAFTVMLLIAFFAQMANKARKAAIRAKLESLGFRVADPPSIIPGIPELLHNLPPLRNGPYGLVWSAVAIPSGGLPTLLLEHRFTSRGRKSRNTHNHTVIATVCPTDWNRFTLTPENFLQRLGDSLGLTKDVDLENPAFNKRWRLKCEHNDATALVVLTPDVQVVLQNAPLDEWWSIGRGTIACCWKRPLNHPELDTLMTRFAQVIQTLNPEIREILETASQAR